MTKSEFDRYSLNNNILKQVIFRIDYKGVVNVVSLIEEFQSRFTGKFKDLDNVFASQIDIQLADIKDIGETLSIPVKELEKQEIYRFTNNTFGTENNVVLDICKYFTTLSINCVNYKTIDEYKNFFVELVVFLYEVDNFISIKRFGLRKIAGEIYFNTKEIFDNFEREYININSKSGNLNSIKSDYIDVIKKDDGDIINYKRSIDSGVFISEDGNKTTAYQVILDIDGYFQEDTTILSNLRDKPQNFTSIIDIVNNHLFELFKMSVTEKFLNRSKDV